MTDKEKAKAYDKAIMVAKNCLEKGTNPANNPLDYFINCVCEMFPDSFPELRESEDERIRKVLIEYFRKWDSYRDEDETLDGIPFPVILAYLEKQKEQKSEVKYVYPKFRKGDIIEPITPNGSYIPVRVRSITDGSYICRSDDDRAFLSLPLLREEEYKVVEQKPVEWSEEDERRFISCMGKLQTADGAPTINSNWFEEHCYKHPSWKPSEEQMLALQVAATISKTDFNTLTSLLTDLQKL